MTNVENKDIEMLAEETNMIYEEPDIGDDVYRNSVKDSSSICANMDVLAEAFNKLDKIGFILLNMFLASINPMDSSKSKVLLTFKHIKKIYKYINKEKLYNAIMYVYSMNIDDVNINGKTVKIKLFRRVDVVIDNTRGDLKCIVFEPCTNALGYFMMQDGKTNYVKYKFSEIKMLSLEQAKLFTWVLKHTYFKNGYKCKIEIAKLAEMIGINPNSKNRYEAKRINEKLNRITERINNNTSYNIQFEPYRLNSDYQGVLFQLSRKE